MLSARAPAKINLTLHVRGRRPDGLHELESLVAFAGVADTLELTPHTPLSLVVDGPTAAAAGDDDDNLVLRAARLLAGRLDGLKVGAFRLSKRLPVAAGLGGGSSDAAAALRLLAAMNGLPPDHPALLEAARATGSDVSVCLATRARMMRGTGEALGPPLVLPPLFAVLVNPGVPVPTGEVFGSLGRGPGRAPDAADHPPVADGMDAAGLLAALRSARNDLEAPAVRMAPVVTDVLALLRACCGCRLARMSGSGATVFGLFDDRHTAAAARRTIAAREPGWWVKATVLR